MSDILKQIQALQEQFSNLFEVEGLGEPSSEVPPSTNKLKKDIKTKNGKVELVSVENELFPYDGNKKEQFQQKVLDTINGMIQGTATLEDLLQIVRQKKAPLKEAMEVLEELLSEDGRHEELMKKYGTDTVQKLPKEVRRKYFPTNRDEVIDGWERYKAGSKSRSHQDLNQYGPEQGKKLKVNLRGEYKEPKVSGNKEAFGYIGKYEPKSDEQRTQGSIARHFDKVLYKPLKKQANITRKAIATEKYQKGNSDALKEAMEVLEELIAEKESYVFPKKAVADGNAKYEKAYKDKVEATRLARKGFEKLNKKIKELEKKGIDTDVDIHPDTTYVNGPKHEYQQALKTASDLHDKQREADRAETEAGHNQRKLRLAGLKGVTMGEFEPVPTKKGDNFKFKKVLNKNEALEEAFEIMEDLIDMIDKAEKVGLNMKGKKAKVQNAREKEINQAAEREGTSPLKIKGRRLSNDDIVKAQQKDQKADKGSKIVRGELEVLGHDFEDKPVYMYKAPLKEALEEALEIMQSLVEATPFETKRRIADKFKDKAMDMYNKAAEEAMENSKKKVELHKKIHQQGGDVPAFAEDKIDTFSDKPEVRKEQEEYNKLVDNGKKSGQRVHKMNNFVNLVNYYKTPKNV